MKWSEVIEFYESKINELANTKNPKLKYIPANYRKFINVIKSAHANLDSAVTDDAIEALDVTDHMKGKLKYYKQNPRELAKSMQAEEKEPDLKSQLLELLGIGEVKIDELIAAGLKSVSQLKMKKYIAMLPDVTQKILQYQPDRKIPHENIKKVEPSIVSLCDQKDGCQSIMLLGSYRRKTAASRDIDVMIVSDEKDILKTFMDKIKSTYGNDNVIPYAIGNDKISILVRFDNIESFKSDKLGVYKLDVFRSPVASAAAMMLYATGSKDHNILMRKNAKNKGFLLNQEGLYERETNKLIPTNSEREIFDKIGMEYKEPHERN
jgi:DNA polymerase/3'-5' exonuclease PolX